MRIVSGAHRGRTLKTPPGDATRPTSDRARQAVFNILEHAPWAGDLHGARVIDLFAGSGALGFEAVSRGAAFAERTGQRIHIVQRFEHEPVPFERLAEHHAGTEIERTHRLGRERGLKGG